MSFFVIIPVRYASTRLPGKPLIDIAGKPMVQHVYERAVASGADQVIIATDDKRISDIAEKFGATVCMTSTKHPTGSDRLAEVVVKLACSNDQIIVNLQGDEPLMPASLIKQVASNLESNTAASVATLCEPIESAEELHDTHVVKVVMDSDGYANYFSRAPIPWHREEFPNANKGAPSDTAYYRHIGLYAYRAGFIKEYVKWPVSQLEKTEALEQLRVLWYGHKIHVAVAKEKAGHGVDTEQDLKRVESSLAP